MDTHSILSTTEARVQGAATAEDVRTGFRLLRQDDRKIGRPLLEHLCRRMGYHHPDARLGPMCGPLFFVEMEAFDGKRDPNGHYLEMRDESLRQFNFDKGEFPEQKQLMRHALDRLDKRMLVPELVRLGYDEGVSDVEKLEPLIRLGEPLLPLRRERQDAERDLSKKGNYEVIAATITGKIEPKVMRRLLTSDDRDRGLACQIVIAAGSRDWTKDIAQLQFRKGFDHNEASQALASVLRKEALPHLRKAMTFDPDNYTAKYAIMELEKWRE